MEALDRVFSESGIIPSKKTRKSIINASEKISHNIQQDLKRQDKKEKSGEVEKRNAPLKISKKKNSELMGSRKIKQGKRASEML